MFFAILWFPSADHIGTSYMRATYSLHQVQADTQVSAQWKPWVILAYKVRYLPWEHFCRFRKYYFFLNLKKFLYSLSISPFSFPAGLISRSFCLYLSNAWQLHSEKKDLCSYKYFLYFISGGYLFLPTDCVTHDLENLIVQCLAHSASWRTRDHVLVIVVDLQTEYTGDQEHQSQCVTVLVMSLHILYTTFLSEPPFYLFIISCSSYKYFWKLLNFLSCHDRYLGQRTVE